MPSFTRTISAESLSSVFNAISRPKGGKRLRKNITKILPISKSKKVRDVVVSSESENLSELSGNLSDVSALTPSNSAESISTNPTSELDAARVSGDHFVVEAPIHAPASPSPDHTTVAVEEPRQLFRLCHEFVILMIQLFSYATFFYSCDGLMTWGGLGSSYLMLRTWALLTKTVGEVIENLSDDEENRQTAAWLKSMHGATVTCLGFVLISWFWLSCAIPFLTGP